MCGMFAVPQSQFIRIHGSSGTTGKPTVVGYTRGDIDMWADVMARSPMALQLRYLQTLLEIGATNSSTIVFPAPIDMISAFMQRPPGEAGGSSGTGGGAT